MSTTLGLSGVAATENRASNTNDKENIVMRFTTSFLFLKLLLIGKQSCLQFGIIHILHNDAFIHGHNCGGAGALP